VTGVTTDSNDDNGLNFFPLTDEQVLARWTIDELDMLHDISGLGDLWQKSDRRAHLKKVEDEEVENILKIMHGETLEENKDE